MLVELSPLVELSSADVCSGIPIAPSSNRNYVFVFFPFITNSLLKPKNINSQKIFVHYKTTPANIVICIPIKINSENTKTRH